MKFEKVKTPFFFYLPYYLISFLSLLGLKLFYSRAGADALTWILAPTAGWVSVLSGIPFTYVAGQGYVNHSLHLLIAPSCCGVQFLCITAAMLIFSFLHRTGALRMRRSAGWILGCYAFSYFFTILINGLRILLAIYIPMTLSETGVSARWLTPERLHTLIGTVVYFSSLLILHRTAALVCLGTFNTSFVRSCLSPVFWYFFIVLGIPFLNRAYADNRVRFWEYAALVLTACLVLLILYGSVHRLILFPQKIRRFFGSHGIIKSRYR